jgi:hypothetical protein
MTAIIETISETSYITDEDMFCFEPWQLEFIMDLANQDGFPCETVEATSDSDDSASRSDNESKDEFTPSIVQSNDICLQVADIICGRDKLSVHHPGNRRFRILIQMYGARYQSSKTRKEKTEITRTIIEMVHNYGGRFVKLTADETFVQLQMAEIHDKVSHALRSTRLSAGTTRAKRADRKRSNRASSISP